MTANQIAYVRQQEEQRHNYAMEGETQRSNLAREAENARANTLNYEASIYASQASMYNAQLNADTQRYAAQLNAAVQQQRTASEREVAFRAQNIQSTKNTWDYMLESGRQAETHRHNLEQERLDNKQINRGTVNTAISAGGKLIGDVLGAGATVFTKTLDTFKYLAKAK